MKANPTQSESEESSLQGLFQALGKFWFFLAIGGILGGAIAGFIAFRMPPIYSAEATLLPNLNEGGNSGLLGQLSFIRSLAGGSSPREDFYEKILISDVMMDRVLDHPWTVGNDTISLFEILDLKSDFPASRQQTERIKRRLRSQVISFSKDQLTSFMTLKVHLPNYPQLAADICNFLLVQLEGFNQKFHQEESRQQREFLAERLEMIHGELAAAEIALSNFIISNRNYSSSPKLAREYARLSRETEAFSQTWIELRGQFELARIEENKALSSITVLDQARAPVFRSRPRRIPMIVAGGLLGCLLGLIAAWWKYHHSPLAH